MPIYEYRCNDCEHQFDALQKVSDDPLTDCPECGASALKKLVSAPSFRLKGGGWYETDFKKDNRRNLADSGDGKKEGGKKDSGDGKAKSADSSGAATKQATKKDAGSGKGAGSGSSRAAD